MAFSVHSIVPQSQINILEWSHFIYETKSNSQSVIVKLLDTKENSGIRHC